MVGVLKKPVPGRRAPIVLRSGITIIVLVVKHLKLYNHFLYRQFPLPVQLINPL